MIETLLTPTEVARMLEVSRSSLYRLSRGNNGPAYIQISPKKRRYRREAVEAYLDSKERGK